MKEEASLSLWLVTGLLLVLFFNTNSCSTISGLQIPTPKQKVGPRSVPADVTKPDLVHVEYTAYYCPQEDQRNYFHGSYEEDARINGGDKTAYGTRPKLGIVATDPDVFPRGTIFIFKDSIGGITTFIAEDVGSRIKGNHIDIFAGFGDEGLKKVKKIIRTGNRIEAEVYRPNSPLYRNRFG